MFCCCIYSLISWPPFSAYYSHYHHNFSIVDFSCDASVEELLSRFNSTCSNVLNAVTRQSKTRSEPWIDDSFHSLGRCCRRAERKRKKDRLHVSFEILKDSLFKYQKAVKKVKCRHLSDIINKKCSRPKTLFNIIKAALNPSDCLVPGVYSASCEEFL